MRVDPFLARIRLYLVAWAYRNYISGKVCWILCPRGIEQLLNVNVDYGSGGSHIVEE